MKYANKFITEYNQKKLPLIDRIVIYDCKTGQELYEAWGPSLVSIEVPVSSPDVLVADEPDLHSPTPQYVQKTIDKESYNTIYIDTEKTDLYGEISIERKPESTRIEMFVNLGFFSPKLTIRGCEYFDEYDIVEKAYKTSCKTNKARTAEDFAMVLRRTAAIYRKAADTALERHSATDEELIKKTCFGMLLPFFSKYKDGVWKADYQENTAHAESPTT